MIAASFYAQPIKKVKSRRKRPNGDDDVEAGNKDSRDAHTAALARTLSGPARPVYRSRLFPISFPIRDLHGERIRNTRRRRGFLFRLDRLVFYGGPVLFVSLLGSHERQDRD